MTAVTVLLVVAVIAVWWVGVRSLRHDNRRIASARRGYPATQPKVYDVESER